MTNDPDTTPEDNAPAASPKHDTPQDRPNVIMPPPNIFLLLLITGIVLDWLFPMNLGHSWGALGLVMVGGAFGLVWYCRKMFIKAETNISPEYPTTSIITDGPYKFSRNPVYAAFLVGYFGLALLVDAPIMMILTGVFYWILDRYVIQPEERYLREKFGGDYIDYMSTANRWF